MANAYSLKINTTTYPLPNTSPPPRLQVDQCSGGLQPRQLIFSEKARHDNATFSKQGLVEFLVTGDSNGSLFYGRIWDVIHQGTPGNERVSYTAYGPKALLNKVFWKRGGKARVSLNLTDPDDDDYEPTLQDKTLTQIINLWWGDMSAEVLSKTGISTLSISVNLPDVVPKDLNYNAPTGSLDILEGLLRWAPGFILYVELAVGGNHTLHILEISALTSIDITLGGENWVQNNQVTSSIQGRYGALEILGKNALDDELLYYDPDDPTGSTLEPDWLAADEVGWTPENATESDARNRVFRAYKQKALDTKEWARSTVRSIPNSTIKVWSEAQYFLGGGSAGVPQLIRIKRSVENYDKENRSFVTAYPVYKRDLTTYAYEPTKVWLRLCRLGSPVSVREPTAGFSGDAYSETGITDVWTKYAENLKTITFKGTATENTTGGTVMDYFAGLRWFLLNGKTLTKDPGGPGEVSATILSHTGVYITTNGSFSMTAGDTYEIEAVDTTGDFDEVIAAIFPGLTASPKPINVTKYDWDDILDDLLAVPRLLNIVAADLHTTGWESIDVVMTDWSINPDSGEVTISGDSESSLAAQSWYDVVSERDMETTVEELDIWIHRNRDKEEDSGATSDAELGGGNIGGILPIDILWTDGDEEGPILGWIWDDVNEGWMLSWPHNHGGDPDDWDVPANRDTVDGGWLDIAEVEFMDATNNGKILGWLWDSTNSGWKITWPHKHSGDPDNWDIPANRHLVDGGWLHYTTTKWEDGTNNGYLEIVWVSALSRFQAGWTNS